jgi:hypothetical protein
MSALEDLKVHLPTVLADLVEQYACETCYKCGVRLPLNHKRKLIHRGIVHLTLRPYCKRCVRSQFTVVVGKRKTIGG